VETVSLLHRGNDSAILNYCYFSQGYKDTAGRPGTVLEVSIVLPLEKAKAIRDEMKKNPDAVRTFFIASAQNVQYADYVWSERLPNYGDITNRRVFFNEQTPTSLQAEVIKKDGSTWSQDAMTENESAILAAEQKAVQDGAINRTKKEAGNASPPPKPEPKKGFLGGLFG